MTTEMRLPKAVFAILSFFALSIRVAPAGAASGDYSNYDDLTEAVLSCEEAVSALADCCPDFNPHAVHCIDHRYRTTSACSGQVSEGHELPRLDLGASQCIRKTSCSDLVRGGTCARAPSLYISASYASARPGDTGFVADAGLPEPLAGACL